MFEKLHLLSQDIPEGGDGFRWRAHPYLRIAGEVPRGPAVFDWSARQRADLESLWRDPTTEGPRERLAADLAAFCDKLGWAPDGEMLGHAERGGGEYMLTLSAVPHELYLLPWEVIRVGASGTYLSDFASAQVRYAVPGLEARPVQKAPERPGVLFAWSAAGGAVPHEEHGNAIRAAAEAGGVAFAELAEFDEARLQAALEAGPPSVLHLLCHGAPGPEGEPSRLTCGPSDAPAAISATRLSRMLRPHADAIRLVVLSTCGSGDGHGDAMLLGSIAQELHRKGIASVVASRYPLSVCGSTVMTRALYDKMLREAWSLERALRHTRDELLHVGDHGEAHPGDAYGIQLYAYDSERFVSDNDVEAERPVLASYPFGVAARPVPASGPPTAELALTAEADPAMPEEALVAQLRKISEDDQLTLAIPLGGDGRDGRKRCLVVHTTIDGAQRLLGAWRSKVLQVAIGVAVGQLVVSKVLPAVRGLLGSAAGKAGAGAAGKAGAGAAGKAGAGAAGKAGVTAGKVLARAKAASTAGRSAAVAGKVVHLVEGAGAAGAGSGAGAAVGGGAALGTGAAAAAGAGAAAGHVGIVAGQAGVLAGQLGVGGGAGAALIGAFASGGGGGAGAGAAGAASAAAAGQAGAGVGAAGQAGAGVGAGAAAQAASAGQAAAFAGQAAAAGRVASAAAAVAAKVFTVKVAIVAAVATVAAAGGAVVYQRKSAAQSSSAVETRRERAAAAQASEPGRRTDGQASGAAVAAAANPAPAVAPPAVPAPASPAAAVVVSSEPLATPVRRSAASAASIETAAPSALPSTTVVEPAAPTTAAPAIAATAGPSPSPSPSPSPTAAPPTTAEAQAMPTTEAQTEPPTTTAAPVAPTTAVAVAATTAPATPTAAPAMPTAAPVEMTAPAATTTPAPTATTATTAPTSPTAATAPPTTAPAPPTAAPSATTASSPSAPAAAEPPRTNVAIEPLKLQDLQISGNSNVQASRKTRAAMLHDHVSSLRGVIHYCVDTKGAVSEASMTELTGYPDYDHSLLAAVRTWRYLPVMIQGAPASACSTVEFIYNLPD